MGDDLCMGKGATTVHAVVQWCTGERELIRDVEYLAGGMPW